MRCERCGARCHRHDWCYLMAERVCPSCFAVANGWQRPRRAARRVPAAVVVGFRWVVGLVGVYGAGRAFDAANEGAGSWFGVFVGLGFTFAAVVWPSSSSQVEGK
jgi:hypothetical protein